MFFGIAAAVCGPPDRFRSFALHERFHRISV
jgi:hypothetical protein